MNRCRFARFAAVALALILIQLTVSIVRADVVRTGTQYPQEVLDLQQQIQELLAQKGTFIDDHDLLVQDHNIVLDLLNHLGSTDPIDQVFADYSALSYCGFEIYGEEGNLSADEQANVNEALVGCYNNLCSAIEQTEAAIRDIDEAVAELRALFTQMVSQLIQMPSAQPSPTSSVTPNPVPSPADINMPSSAPMPSPSPSPVPAGGGMPSSWPTPTPSPSNPAFALDCSGDRR